MVEQKLVSNGVMADHDVCMHGLVVKNLVQMESDHFTVDFYSEKAAVQFLVKRVKI